MEFLKPGTRITVLHVSPSWFMKTGTITKAGGYKGAYRVRVDGLRYDISLIPGKLMEIKPWT